MIRRFGDNMLITVLIAIFAILLLGVLSLWYIWFYFIKSIHNNDDTQNSNHLPEKNINHDLDELVQMMREEKEEKNRLIKEKELSDYALNKRKMIPTGGIMSSGLNGERPVNIKSHDMVPYNLSELDKAILEEFYKQ